MRSTSIAALLLLLLVLVPASLRGQESGSPPLPAEAVEIISEMEGIQDRLSPLHERVLSDPAIRESRDRLRGGIQLAMEALDPSIPGAVARYSSLQRELDEALAARDEDRVVRLYTEFFELDQRFQAAEARALRAPEIAERVKEFEAEVRDKMKELDPAVDDLIDRLLELDARLRLLMAGERGDG